MKSLEKLKIEKHALGGYGLGFSGGKAIFVPYAHPGDEVDVLITKERKDIAFARVQNYRLKAEIPPEGICSAFGPANACGGCDWQDLSYKSQLRFKYQLLGELFQKSGFDTPVKPFVPSPIEFHYRNKVFMPVFKSEDGLSFGIYERGSHRIVTHSGCRIHPPIFDTLALRTIQICQDAKVQAYDEKTHTGHLRHIGFRINSDESQLLLILVTRSAKLPFSGLLIKKLTEEFPTLTGIIQNINRHVGNVILGGEEKLLWGKAFLQDKLLDKRFRIQYNSFWQVNIPLTQLIIQEIKKHIKPGCTLIDVFSGCGSLGISLAEKVRQVICVESNAAATADGEINAMQNDVKNIGFLCARAEDALPTLLADEAFNIPPLNIILDPPRAGCQKPVLEAIIHSQPSRILYLSCSVITLVRDLKILCDEGNYRITKIQPFDMFPQTWHIETLVILERKS